MSDPQRRDFLAAAAGIASLATLGGTQPAEAGDPSFMNNVPDPLLVRQGAADLQVRAGEVGGQGHRQQLRQGGDRQAVADLQGDRRRLDAARAGRDARAALARHRRRVGVRASRGASARRSSTPGGLAETNDFEPGDVWYFPRGHGHMLECLGDKPCHFILIFDNGYFSEFGTFSITDWIGHTPQAAAGEELRPARVGLRRLPEGGGVLRPRPPPPAEPPAPLQGWKLPPQTHKYRLLAQPPHSTYQGRPRVAGRFQPVPDLEDGHRRHPRPRARRAAELHWHPTADEWQYVIEGEVSVTMFGSHGRYRTETPAEGRRRLHPAGLRPLDRERRRRSLPHPDRLQHRHLRGDRPVAMDRRQPGRRAGHQLRQAASLFEKFPHHDVFVADRTGRGG